MMFTYLTYLKNNIVISNEDVQKIKNYTEDAKEMLLKLLEV